MERVQTHDFHPPSQFNQLSGPDQAHYNELRARVGSSESRYNRNRRVEAFQRSLRDIRAYCIRGDSGDSLRCFVCGICWISQDELAVNVRHLGVVLNKSKSTINGVFRQMRYERVPLTLDNVQSFRSQLPLLSNAFHELKFWSIRRNRATVPMNAFPNEMESERSHDSEIDPTDFESDSFLFPQ